jgi:enoyl-CoA hydratase
MIDTERAGDVAVLAIDRHERRNAVDAEHCELLRAAVRQATVDGARAIVVTGRGSSFCSGADLGTVYGGGFRDALYGMLAAITRTPVPVIAAVNGPAIGAGTQLAIACDLRVAADPARFAVPTARNGLAVDPWTVRRLALLAGGGTARALLIGCDTLDADQAYGRGLADRRGEFAAAMAWAEEIATLAPLTLAYSKLALDRLLEPPTDDPDVAAAFAACWSSTDLEEANRARLEKRPPRFTGR